jgi:hypothetical protein
MKEKNFNRFYVYAHIRLDTGTVFYVGKGFKNRAYRKYNRNKYWKNITNKCDYHVEILVKNLTEQEAFDKEIQCIKIYREYGFCEANLTDGGEGGSGYIPSKETRKKMGESNKGKRLGYKVSTETKKKQGLAKKGKKLSEKHKNNIAKGLKGRILSLESKKKIAKSHLGMKHSQKSKQKISLNSANAIKIIDIKTGRIYNCISKVAKKFKIARTTLKRWLDNDNLNKTNFRIVK